MKKLIKKLLLLFAIGTAISVLLCAIFWADIYMWSDRKLGDWYFGENRSISEVDKDFKFPLGMPSDPGELGKETIEGIDSDGDGVRDDVQRWIYALFPNEPRKQMAFRQWAKNLQDDLRPDFGPQQHRTNAIEFFRVLKCLQLVFGAGSEDSWKGQYLKAKVFNTYARTMRMYENDERFSQREMAALREEKVTDPCDEK